MCESGEMIKNEVGVGGREVRKDGSKGSIIDVVWRGGKISVAWWMRVRATVGIAMVFEGGDDIG